MTNAKRGKKLYGAFVLWLGTERLWRVSHSSRALLRRYGNMQLVIRPVAKIPGTDKWRMYPDR